MAWWRKKLKLLQNVWLLLTLIPDMYAMFFGHCCLFTNVQLNLRWFDYIHNVCDFWNELVEMGFI